jgi:hypothetical protein
MAETRSPAISPTSDVLAKERLIVAAGWVCAAAFGAVFGVAVVPYVMHGSRTPAAVHPAVEAPIATGDEPTRPIVAPGAANVEQRLTALEWRANAAKSEPAPPPVEHSAPPDPVAFRRSEVEQEHVLAQRVAVEGRDGAWASASEASIRKTLDELASGQPFRVADVDCRTTMCAARLDWPNYEAARGGGFALVGAIFQPSCGHAMF